MSRAFAVAAQLIAEGIRMKLALVFLALLGLIVLGLPFSITGDNSLTGAVQSFMTYALTATGFLLSLLTIFLCRSLSDDLVDRQIFLIMTKPIPRWQFILGKWLGMVAFNGLFLTFSGLATYGLVHYLRYAHPPLEERYDRATLQNEILVARHALKVKLPDFRIPAEREFQTNKEEGRYADLPNFNEAQEKARLAKKYEARWRIVGPGEQRVFEFENVLVDRSRCKELQIRYKTEVSRYPPDEVFRAAWAFGNPLKNTPVFEGPEWWTRHAVGRYHTIRVPVEAVAADHTLTAVFTNVNPFENEPIFRNVIEFRAADEVEVLFVVGSFEGNMLRVYLMLFGKLAFLSAVALAAATAFSFPVACLCAFTIYVLAGGRAFLIDSLDFLTSDQANAFTSVKEFIVRSIMFLLGVMGWLIPDFARFDPIETFVNGRNVGLVWLLQAITDLVLVKTALVLGAAMLLFQRREVAEVSV